MARTARPPGDHPPDDDPGDAAAADDASSRRLASLDDRLGGHASAGSDAPAAETFAARDLTPEMAGRIDTMLVLRMAALGKDGPKGPRVFGKYHVVRRIGEGGFATVFEAIDTKLVRREALKIARPEILLDTRKTRRFLREARLAARVSHPHIVAIHEVGEHDRLPYIAEELCSGSLEDWLERHPGPVAPRVAAETVRLLADAVAVAHGAGVLHRDIKPGNVLIVPSASGPLPSAPGAEALRSADRLTVKLGDFGLSQSMLDGDDSSSAGGATEDGTILGTPEWMAPEQIAPATGARGTDERTDIYALGLVLDRMLTGRSLHAGRSRDDVYRRILCTDPVPADRVVPGIPADLVAVCLRCLAKDPAERYAGAVDLAADLARFLEGRPTVARPLSPVARAARFAWRHPAHLGVVAAAVAALLCGGVAWRESLKRHDQHVRQLSDERAADAAFHLRRGFETLARGNARGAIQALVESAAADPGLADSIAAGWLLGRVHGERATLLGPDEPIDPGDHADVHRIALAPDGRRLAAAGADGVLVLLPLAADATPAGAAARLETGAELNEVAFAPDGLSVATGAEDGRVTIRDAVDGRSLREVAGGGPGVFGLAFSPDGRTLVWGGADRALRIASTAADAPPPVVIRPFDPPGSHPEPGTEDKDIEAICFLDAERLLVAIHHEVCVVQLRSGSIERRFAGQSGDVWDIDVSPDGTRLLATGWFERVGRVWDLATGDLLVTLPPHPAWVQRGSFSPDSRTILTACKDGVLRVFDAGSGDLIESLVGHIDKAWDGSVHPSGAVISSGADGTVRRWEVAEGPPGGTTHTLPFSGVCAVVPLPARGLVAVYPGNGAPVAIDAATGGASPLPLPSGRGNRFVVSDPHSGRIAICHEDGLRLDASLPGTATTIIDGVSVLCAAFGPTGSLFASLIPGTTARGGGRLLVWPDPDASPIEVAAGPAAASSIAVMASPRGRLAMAEGTRITIFDLAADGTVASGGGRLIADLAPRVSPGILLAWSPDGTRLAWGSTGGLAGILDARTGRQTTALTSFARAVRGIEWADDGRSLVIADEESVRLVDATGTTFDEIRPGWRIESMAIQRAIGAERLVVAGDAFVPAADGAATGRILVLDLSRRLPGRRRQ